MVKTALSCLFIMLLAEICVEAKAWRGIVPLHSTREDVERLLGVPPDPRKEHASVYQLGNETVSIFYASGPPCGDDAFSGWQVPRGTVVSIIVSPKTRLPFSSIYPDESKFRKKSDLHRRDIITYFDDSEGESIDVFLGDIISTHYLPAAKDKHLECPRSPATINDLRRHYPRLDRYSDISFTDEKIRLDNFAGHLRQDSELKGYIVVYAGRRTSVEAARARAKRAKNYLVNTRNIKDERVVTIFGGDRREFTVELYMVGRSPTPAPRD